MRTDPEPALYGLYCRSRRLGEEGVEFHFPEVKPALQDQLGKPDESRAHVSLDVNR